MSKWAFFSLQFAVLWKLSLVLKHNFLAQLGEYLPYRFETLQEKALKKELAEKNDYIHKLEIQPETLREMMKEINCFVGFIYILAKKQCAIK